MKAHQLINGASYGPDVLNVITRAFDEAWAVVAGNFGESSFNAGRTRLATALLSVAREDSLDVDALKRRALQAMSLSYAERPFDRAS
jgi:hypothetical protein